MAETATASRVDLARQYLAFQRENKVDDLLTLMADDIVLSLPMLADFSGKAAVEKQLRSRPMGGGADVQWLEPEEEGDGVILAATGGRFGTLRLQLTFNDANKVSKVTVAVGSGGGYGFQPPPLNMAWAKAPTERPPRPKDFGPDGFTLRMADYGSYGWAPDHWPYQNDTPRGAWPAPADNRGLPAPYTIFEKAEVWADCAADLYEAAIHERWAPATEISWGSIEPLPDHIELALDQIYTNISEVQYNSNQVLMGWLKDISYGYHEVKLYLATQVFEQARHCEAFRKRALANGGGLGVQTPGFMHRTVYSAFRFTEYVCYVNILRASLMLGLCEWGDKLGRSQADRQLFENTANDLRRHIAYGVDHLKFYVRHGEEDSLDRVTTWLNRGEAMMAADLRRDTALREASILALGDSVVEGKAQLKELRAHQLQRYLQALETATIYDRGNKLIPAFKDVVESP
jgi:translation elongation factor EF-1beta